MLHVPKSGMHNGAGYARRLPDVLLTCSMFSLEHMSQLGAPATVPSAELTTCLWTH